MEHAQKLYNLFVLQNLKQLLDLLLRGCDDRVVWSLGIESDKTFLDQAFQHKLVRHIIFLELQADQAHLDHGF